LRIVLGTGIAVLGASPVFMIGALGVLVSLDFHVSAARIGAIGSIFFAVSALTTPAVSSFVDARGGGWGTAAALGTAAGSCLIVAAAPAGAFWLLIVAALLGGV